MPELVGKEPLAAAVVVTALEVEIVLDVVTGGLVIAVVGDETLVFEVDVLMVVGALDTEPGTHCEYHSLFFSQ